MLNQFSRSPSIAANERAAVGIQRAASGRVSMQPNVLQVKPVSILVKSEEVSILNKSVEKAVPSTQKDLVGLGTAACIGLRVILSEQVYHINIEYIHI